jgi:hypothetical protein
METEFTRTFVIGNLTHIQETVKQSISIRQCLLSLGIAGQGGNYRIFHRYIKKHGIDTSHFLGMAANRGKKHTDLNRAKIFTIQDMFINPHISSHKLRKRLISDNIFPHQCSYCQFSNWNDQPIPLELDHIDGNHQNNQLINLRLLCPNCHAQTSTYRGKNKGKNKK